MNKGILTGGAIIVAAAVVGWGAMGMLNDDQTSAPTPLVSQSQTGGAAAVSAGSSTDTRAEDYAPQGVYAGMVTKSGGFTGDVLEGSPDAPVTIIEYASLTCPHCASFHDRIYKPLKESHIDTDKVKFIYRDFPLNNPAIAASIIARCGGEDRYLAFVDLFLSQQDQWTRAEDWMGELQKMARFGGLGADKINECLSDTALGQSVIDRYRAGSDVFKVTSTPTILIDGEKYTGDMSYTALSEFIDSKL